MRALGDYIHIKHGFAFKGEYITTNDNGVVLVTPGNFSIGGGFKEDKCKFYSSSYSDEYVLRPDDLIVTMTDLSKGIDTLGYSALVPKSDRVYLHNQRIGLVQIINPEVDKHYLYWFLRTYDYQRKIASTSSGSTVHHTSPDRIYAIEVFLPEKRIQKRIASFLDALDQKIETNNRINDNLLQQLQTIHQSFFDKKSKSFEKSGCLSDICGYSQRKVFVETLTPDNYYSTENMLPEKQGAVTATSLPSIAQTTGCMPGDVLISNIRPYFKKIVYCKTECGCSTDVLCFVPKDPILSP